MVGRGATIEAIAGAVTADAGAEAGTSAGHFFLQLGLGSLPVIDRVSRLAAPLYEDLVRARFDRIRARRGRRFAVRPRRRLIILAPSVQGRSGRHGRVGSAHDR
jgi:hypothetical protein